MSRVRDDFQYLRDNIDVMMVIAVIVIVARLSFLMNVSDLY